MHLYVCYHKLAPLYTSDIFCPIHVGRTVVSSHLDMIGDNTGDNISNKNPYFCELTATYWIWKNVQDDIVGLCHYRRYFNFKNDHTKVHNPKLNFADELGNNLKTLAPLFEQYDIILPEKKGARRHPISLYDFYAKEHIQSDLDMVLDIIHEKYPHHYQTAYDVLHKQTAGYYANMLIAKKDIFDAYAKWMFDILFELEKRIQSDVKKREPYQQRVYGFLSERMMTVWIALHPELKIKEVPIVFIEENKKRWRKYLFRRWRSNIFKVFRKEKHG